MSRAPYNPFYNRSNSNAGAAGANTGSTGAYTPSSEPVSYSSLSDLGKGRQSAPPPSYSYTPQPERQGYKASSSAQSGRRMPPPPSNYGVDIPEAPPRRQAPTPAEGAAGAAGTAAAPTAYSRLQSAGNTAAGYIPNSVSATATSVGDRARGAYDSVVNEQTRQQVMTGAGKAAAGAAKLAGKAAWQLGKFASSSK